MRATLGLVALVSLAAMSCCAFADEVSGRQFVVFVAGDNSILTPTVSDQIVAYALPR